MRTAVPTRFPPRNAGASLKRQSVESMNLRIRDFPRAMRGPH